MPWKVFSLVEARLRLCKALLRGEQTVEQLARSFGISRKTAYKWLGRFTAGGQGALGDRSQRPRGSPKRIRPGLIERIGRLRRQHPFWGAKKIRAFLQARRIRVPAERTIARWLERLHLIVPRRRRPRKACWVKLPALTVAQRANQVWTVDFKGWFRTGDGRRVEPLTVRDAFSRYSLAVRLLPDQRWTGTREVFSDLFRRYGLPEIIRTDNGGPFASTGPGGLSRLTRPVTRTRRGQQHRMTRWLKGYNEVRPHEALEQKVPAAIYRTSRVRMPERLPVISYGAGWPLRRVRSNGEIKWEGRKRFIGEAFVGQTLGIKALQKGKYGVYFGSMLIGHLHSNDPGAMRPAIYGHKRRSPLNSKM